MDFGILLNQISELEQLNREEEQKFLKESAAHSYTKSQLQSALEQQEKMKQREVQLLEEIAIAETKYKAEMKLTTQLKQTITSLKQDCVLLKQHTESEISLTKEKREEYLALMEKYMKQFSVIQKDTTLVIQHSGEKKGEEASSCHLNQEITKRSNEIEQLKQKLKELAAHGNEQEIYTQELEQKIAQCARFVQEYQCVYCGGSLSMHPESNSSEAKA